MLNINPPSRPISGICLALNSAATRTHSTAFYAHAKYTPHPKWHTPLDQHIFHSTTTIIQAPAASKAERATWNEASSIPSWLCDLGQLTSSLCPHL